MGVTRFGVGAAALAAALGLASVACAQPANDDCANATVIASLPFSDLGVDMTTATVGPGEPLSDCSGGGTNSVWYRVPATASHLLRGGLATGTGSRYGVGIFTGGCGALVEKWCQDSSGGVDVAVAAEGQDVWIEVVNLNTVGTLDFTLDEVPEFLVDAGGSRRNSVAGGPDGFLAAWHENTAVPNAQRFDATGTPVGSPLTIAPLFAEVDVAGAGDGSFVLVWGGSGARLEPNDSVVSLPLVSPGSYAKVAADADGDFVVVWGGVNAQLFERDGTPVGPAFEASPTGYYTNVAMAPNGDFVVVWGGADDGDDDGIAGRLPSHAAVASGGFDAQRRCQRSDS